MGVFGHPGAVDLLAQLVELALLAAAEFFLDGLDLLVEVVLFLRLFHLTLYASLDRAVHTELFDFDIKQLGDAGQPFDRIEDLEQNLLLRDRQLQIRADGIGQLAGIVHANRGDHRFIVEVLTLFDVLLKQGGHAPDQRLDLLIRLHVNGTGFQRGGSETPCPY